MWGWGGGGNLEKPAGESGGPPEEYCSEKRKEKKMGNLCNHTPRGKILPFGNLTFYFSNSMDFVKNKSPFIHYNSDIKEPSKNTLVHFDIINYSTKSCST